MKGQAAHFRPVHLAQQSLHCICTIIGGDEVAVDEHNHRSSRQIGQISSAARDPHSQRVRSRPSSSHGLSWPLDCAEAEGRTGDVFLFKNSALRFAKKNSGRSGCATMFLAERLELDVENQGNRLIAWIGTLLNLLTRYVPKTIRHRSHCSRDSANQNGCGQQNRHRQAEKWRGTRQA